jgi:hypothetical protein
MRSGKVPTVCAFIRLYQTKQPDECVTGFQARGRGVNLTSYDATCGGMDRNACITWFAMCRLLEYPML